MTDRPHTSILGASPRELGHAVLVAGALGLFTFMVLRGLDQPSNYAFSHWLLDWRQGFIKRGLVGTIVHPLLVNKTPREVQFIVVTLCTATLTGTFLALLRAAWGVWRRRGSVTHGWFLAPVLLAFLGSSAIVVAASTVGFFDHLLTLLTLASIVLVARGWTGWAALLAVVGLGVHELYAVCGLPMVLFAMVLRAAVHDGREGGGTVGEVLGAWRRVAGPAAIPLVALVLMAWSQATMPADRIDGVRAGLAETGAIDAERIDNAVYHLEHGVSEGLAKYTDDVVERVLDPRIGRMVWPTLVALLGAGAALLVSAARRAWVPFLVAAALAPELALLLAADTTRFTNLTVVQAFLGLVAVVTIAVPARGGPVQVSARAAWVLSALAGVAVVANLAWRIPLLSARVDGEAVFMPRDEAPPRKR